MFKKIAEFFDISEKHAKIIIFTLPITLPIGYGLLFMVAWLSPGI